MNSLYKSLFVFLPAVFSAVITTAQISEYYTPALDMADADLKAALHEIINGHQTFPYSSGATDTWDILKEADRDPDNPENVILVYSGRSVNGPQEFNNGNGWNREHVWPRSRGGFSTSAGVGTDAHNLKPCDIQVNNTRGNRVFANCSNCSEVFSEGLPTGSFLDNTGGTFEPRDEVKGDMARLLFYMAVRYEGNGELDMELVDELLPEGSNAPLMAVLGDLLDWNIQDPVDDFEMIRNEVIFGYQGNRNPFIDHPELAEHLWGDMVGLTWPSTVSTSSYEENMGFTVYPNPTFGQVNISADFKELRVSDAAGREVSRFERNANVDFGHLPQGVYILHLTAPEGDVKVGRVLKL